MLLTRIQSQKFIQSPYTPFRLTSIQFYPQWFRRPIFSPPRGSLAPEPLQIESLTIDRLAMEGFFVKLFGPGFEAEQSEKAASAFR